MWKFTRHGWICQDIIKIINLKFVYFGSNQYRLNHFQEGFMMPKISPILFQNHKIIIL